GVRHDDRRHVSDQNADDRQHRQFVDDGEHHHISDGIQWQLVSGTIAAGGSQNVSVTFAPSLAINYGGTVTVAADQTSGIATTTASGTGVAPPTVTITSPNDAASFVAPAAITVNATASGSAGIDRVEFYSGTTAIGTATAP